MLTVSFTETPDQVEVIYIETPEGVPQGEGIGSRFTLDAKAYSDQTGKRLLVPFYGFFADQTKFMKAIRLPDGSMGFLYDPQGPSEGTTARVAAQTCPTCGDPLKGEHGTFCPRCQWSESDANLDHDPLSNPPDPTVDMHRGIQATTIPSHRWAKWFEAVENL